MERGGRPVLQTRVAVKYHEYQGRSKHDVQHVSLHYLVGIWRLAGFEDRAQPLDVICRHVPICAQIIILNKRYPCRIPNSCANYSTRCRYRMQEGDELQTCTAIKILHAETELLGKDDFYNYHYRSVHQNRLLFIYCIVKESQSNGRHTDSPRCCKCCRTMRMDTGCAANMSIS